MSPITRGERELSERLDKFPANARAKLTERITSLTERLDAMIEAAAPYLTGLLRSEITQRVFSDAPNRIAGYVSVFASANPKREYAKAATLEYGSDLARRIPDKSGVFRKLGRGQKRIESHLTKAAHIVARRYLRGPLAEMRPEIDAELSQALTEATNEGS